MAEGEVDPAPAHEARPIRDEDWQRGHSRWGLWINGVIGFCTVLGFLLLMYQTHLARQDAADSERSFLASLEQTRRSAEAAQRAADAAQKTAEVADRALQLDHRAWVGVMNVSPPGLQAGSNITFNLQMSNSGRSPALNVRANTSYRLLSAKTPFKPLYKNKASPFPPSRVVIQPNMTMSITGLIDEPLSAADVEAIQAGTKALYLFGRIDYTDVFKVEHYSTFCLFITKDHTSGTGCGEYSEAN